MFSDVESRKFHFQFSPGGLDSTELAAQLLLSIVNGMNDIEEGLGYERAKFHCDHRESGSGCGS